MASHDMDILTFSVILQGLRDIPRVARAVKQISYNNSSPLSRFIKAEAIKIDSEVRQLTKEAEDSVQAIEDMATTQQMRRGKRSDQVSAPLQTVGDLLGISTGVATRPEVNIIIRNFKKLTDYVLASDTRTAISGHTLVSLLQVQEATIRLVMAQINIYSLAYKDRKSGV